MTSRKIHHTQSQPELILAHLKKSGRITPLQALGQYSIFRLAAVIHRLRARDHDIKTRVLDAPSGGTYAEYYLEPAKPRRHPQRPAQEELRV